MMDTLLSASLEKFPSLSALNIVGCPKTAYLLRLLASGQRPLLQRHWAATLVSLQIKDCEEEDITLPLPSPPRQEQQLAEGSGGFRALTSLNRLDIGRCPKLLEAALLLPDAGGGGGLPSSLVELGIIGGGNGDTFNMFPPDMFRHSTALKELCIWDCCELTSLAGFQALPSLRTLHIDNCPKLQLLVFPGRPSPPPPSSPLRILEISDSRPREIKRWLLQIHRNNRSSFPSLRELKICGCPQLTSFDDGDGDGDGGIRYDNGEMTKAPLELPKSLHHLRIKGCQNLRSLPAKLSSLSSLERLSIKDCPQIQSFPEMGLPTSLQYLDISGCPTLKERCKKDVGPDWPKISRIHHLVIP